MKPYAVIPGGGLFADSVRVADRRLGLPARVSHRMAILSMDIYGLLLASLIPNGVEASSLAEALKGWSRGLTPVILPSRLPEIDDLPETWDVTSDSIALKIAQTWAVDALILVKDVDGVFTGDPRKERNVELLPKVKPSKLREVGETCVDRFFPVLLECKPIRCLIVNGLKPRRVLKALEGAEVKGTVVEA